MLAVLYTSTATGVPAHVSQTMMLKELLLVSAGDGERL